MPGSLTHRTATVADAGLLAAMNRQLIEDEGHRNPMTLPELEARMRGWLARQYLATIFTRADRVVAYALWRDKPDFVYLRQFFVARECRREGVGREAIRLLVDEVLPANKRVRVDVLVTNQPGLEFWRAVGFGNYALTLEMDR